jgi:hypothetical protein
VVVAARVWGSLRVGVAPRWEGDSSDPGGAVRAERRAELCGNPRRQRPWPWEVRSRGRWEPSMH